MGVRKIMLDHPPDLVISGVNSGQNIAEDVTYSGTIAGAMEATILGIPSIALSQVYDFFAGRRVVHWECAQAHGVAMVRRLLEAGIPRNVLMNVNFPNCPPHEVQGVAVTMQGRRSNDLMKIEDRKDGRGNPYHWISFQRGNFTPGAGTDLLAVDEKKISITPLQLDLTDHPTVTRLAAVFEEEARGGNARRSDRRRGARSAASGACDGRACGTSPIMRAFEAAPREAFAPYQFRDLANNNMSLPIGCGQTMSRPADLARRIEALRVGPRASGAGGGRGLRLRRRPSSRGWRARS